MGSSGGQAEVAKVTALVASPKARQHSPTRVMMMMMMMMMMMRRRRIMMMMKTRDTKKGVRRGSSSSSRGGRTRTGVWVWVWVWEGEAVAGTRTLQVFHHYASPTGTTSGAGADAGEGVGGTGRYWVPRRAAPPPCNYQVAADTLHRRAATRPAAAAGSGRHRGLLQVRFRGVDRPAFVKQWGRGGGFCEGVEVWGHGDLGA